VAERGLYGVNAFQVDKGVQSGVWRGLNDESAGAVLAQAEPRGNGHAKGKRRELPCPATSGKLQADGRILWVGQVALAGACAARVSTAETHSSRGGTLSMRDECDLDVI